MSLIQFQQAVENRRSLYALSNASTISDEQIQNIINHAVKHTPSAFNSQTARIVLLLGEEHTKLWGIVTETLRKILPAESFADTQNRMDMFNNAYGTILFFEDEAVIESLQEQFATYKDNFPIWSLQSSGMLQYVIWTALETEGLGGSLQHYNPLIDEEVKATWGLPAKWKLLAQMPFGTPVAPAAEKQFQPVEERVKVFA